MRAEFLLAMGLVEEAREAAVEAELGEGTRFAAELPVIEGRWEEAEEAMAASLAEAAARHDLSTAVCLTIIRVEQLLLERRTAEASDALAACRALLPPELATWAALRLDSLGALVAHYQGAHRSAAASLARCRPILASGEDYRGLAGLVHVAEATAATDPTEASRHTASAVATFH